MKRLLGRRCAAGHLIDGANGSWQMGGSGHVGLTCRKCNAIRAKAWRAANADKLGYRVGATQGGKVLVR
jgi:RNase P subunit RPR2